MPNKMFPLGIDPLTDLIQIKKQLNEVTDAVIQLQTNQNELIKAVTDLMQTQQTIRAGHKAIQQHITKQDAEIKELRNSLAPSTTTD